MILLLLACFDPEAPFDPADSTEILFEVPKGTSPTGVHKLLLAEGLAPDELQWKVYTKQNPDNVTCIKAGTFSLNKAMSLNEVMKTLCGTPIPDDVSFTVLEGWRIRDTDKALAEAGFIEAGAYTAVATSKGVTAPFEINASTYEGYLWPETYKVPPPGRFTPEQLVTRQLAAFKTNFLDANAESPDLKKRGLNDIVVMASMLEREEPKPSNRPLVAGILWKRIDSNNALGVDATSRYTLVDWNDRRSFIRNLKDPNEPYNTRLKKGLPPTAIGAPTKSSLEAAMRPKDSPYWYYLHDGQGNLHPGRNAAEHEANRKKYNVY